MIFATLLCYLSGTYIFSKPSFGLPGESYIYKTPLKLNSMERLKTVAGNTNLGVRLSTVDLLTKVACFVKNEIIFSIEKGADLNYLLQGGQLS
jgi:hypothetical protein